ncbi:hypothetical protein H2200_001132 [Cladophialophora chaetospira]|uniref:Uncharacterized protein n=1 Tax=Cladophialophora chaetospira TaxID=386627 RepID=A0AA38XL90_9EURO|nr:hypothetical protein H2200_001132 [Cladophialophora chaetospira]
MKNTFSSIVPAAVAAVALLSGQAQAKGNDTTVIQVFWITEQQLSLNSLNDYPLAGSIVTADASTTVVAVQCTGSFDPEVCGTDAQTITYGSSTWIASETVGNLGISLECSVATESAVCTGQIAAPQAIFTDPSIDTSEISELLTATTASVLSTSYSGTISSTDFTYLPVTITAGQDKLSGTSSSSKSSGSSTFSTSGSASGTGAASASSSFAGPAQGNGAGSLGFNLGLSEALVGFLGMVMMVL